MARWLRMLFEEQQDYAGTELYADVVVDWLDDVRAALDEARSLQDPTVPVGDDPLLQEQSWHLYALTRVLDYFVWPLQPQASPDCIPDTSPRSAVGLCSDELEAFAAATGLTVVRTDAFHPFYHEPVRVDVAPDADADGAPVLVASVWPTLMLDNMLVYRGGVQLKTSDAQFARNATTAPLYWSRYRRARPSVDLSLGWGHNSQWRTEFRRDFDLGDAFLYNADGKFCVDEPPTPADDARGDMTDADWIHLLRFRYPRAPIPDALDPWPWDYRHVEAKSVE